ncbi:MAG: hypothetical protein WC289_00910 [Patescibacteria group bacterium]|jgi:hypothetical protein
MQQFVVPQFIDVENKILGPITVRQFVTFLIGFGLIFLELKIFQFWIGAMLGVVTFGVTGLFAFAKVNGRRFHYFVLTIIQTLQRPKLQVWNKTQMIERIQKEKEKKKDEIIPPKRAVSASRLAELSLIVDTGGAYQEGIKEIMK